MLGARKLGEADRIITMLSEQQGKVSVVAKGARRLRSRFGGRLEIFTLLRMRLHEGRSNLYTLTGADTVATHDSSRSHPAALRSGMALVEMIGRSIPEHEPRRRMFNLLVNYLSESDRAVAAGAAATAFRSLALGAELKLLLLLGYLPHLSHCSLCGGAEVAAFSAAAGGTVCPGCSGGLPVSPGSLALMRRLLEEPLSQARQIEAPGTDVDQAWRCVREVCRYHLGFDPRLRP